jgi:hypothetical protein
VPGRGPDGPSPALVEGSGPAGRGPRPRPTQYHNEMATTCYGCGATLRIDGPVGRRTTCPECDSDLHTCFNCRHWDPAAAHECREPQTEHVVDKDSANACDLYQLGDGASRRKKSSRAARSQLAALFGEAPPEEEDPKDALEALFRKK